METATETQAVASEAMTALEFLEIATGYLGVLVVTGFALVVLWRMLWGKIDLTMLVSEKDGSASLSRFQFLVFTFVIGFSLVLMVIAKLQKGEIGFPEIDSGVWTLLGISSGSYVVSKGIQRTGAADGKKDGQKPAGWAGKE